MPSQFTDSPYLAPPPPSKAWGKWRLIYLAFPAFMIFVAVMVVRSVVFGGEESSGPKGELLWWLDAKAAPLQPHGPVGWPSGDVFAIAAGRQVTGYGIADGKKRWAVPLPGDVCAASTQMASGRVAVLHGAGGGTCDRVQVVDVQRGKAVWQRPLPLWDSSGTKGTQVVIANGAVAVQREDEGINAFRLRDGRPLWRRIGLFNGCLYSAVGGGRALVAEQTCGGGTSGAVQLLGAADGRPRWTRPLGEDIGVTGIFSTDPVVIGIGETYDGETTQVLMLDDAGAPAGRVKLDKYSGQRSVHCASGEVTRCDGIVLSGTTVYLRAKTDDFGPQKVTAYDLASGRDLWTSKVTGRAELVPVGFHGGRLIAAHPPVPARKRGYSGDPSAVLALDPRTGKDTELMTVSESMTGIDAMIRGEARLYWADGRLILLRYGPRPGDGPVLAAFGPPNPAPARKQ
ncbi:PQQ-binding-like beta-propeller repeat protein [Actinomadura sp. 9N215]|uniref:outer membrane protein assembly factor BamB family protein n=1 Tax=Actinomadura sp. 9N215 TaxID=3375150 RepID=UPI0037B2EDDD